MKKLFVLLSAALVMSALVGCQNDVNEDINIDNNTEGTSFVLSANINSTRTTTNAETFEVDWVNGDVVYVATTDGTWGPAWVSGENTATAYPKAFTFDGEKFTTDATIAAGTYTFNAIYASESQRTYHRGASTTHQLYATQSMDATAPTANLKSNDALVGQFELTTPTSEAAKVTMEHLYTLMQVNVKNNTGADITVKQFSMVAAGATLAGIFNVDFDNLALNNVKSGASESITVNVDNGTVANGGTLPIYFVMAPLTNYSGEITFVVTDTDDNTYTKSINASNMSFDAGTYNTTPYKLTKADEKADLSKGAWVLVENAADLAVNDNILIVAANSNYAMSTTQNNNNRGQEAIEKQENLIADITDNVQIITLEEGSVANTFALKVTGGYLYAASSSSNHLKTQATINNNASWAITISNNVASIIAKGSNSRNVMQHNETSSIFSCYGSASQKALSIYKHDPNVVVLHKLDAPVVKATVEDYNTITVEWEEVPNAVSYKVTCGEETKETTETSVSFTDLEYGKTYDISVVAIADGVNYKDSNATTIKATTESNPNASTTTNTVTIDEVYGSNGTMASDKSSISWTNGDITITNKKGSTAIRTTDTNHYRVYQGSKLTIGTAKGNITKIVITCTSDAYATVMKTSFTNANYAATVSGSVVTVTGNASEYTMTASAQTRLSKVVVTYEQ